MYSWILEHSGISCTEKYLEQEQYILRKLQGVLYLHLHNAKQAADHLKSAFIGMQLKHRSWH